MTLPRLLFIFAVLLFGTIALTAIFKRGDKPTSQEATAAAATMNIPLNGEVRVVAETAPAMEKAPTLLTRSPQNKGRNASAYDEQRQVPEVDRVDEFFNRGSPQFPIIETIIYHSRVPWQKGRPAWLSDYAAHYRTSRHFIARSLNGKPDYLKQDISEGDRFNILRPEKNVEFYLVVDLHRNKMLFYYIDLDTKERVLVKTYSVGLGRIDSSRSSGFLTPLGKYSLGDRVSTYRPAMKGFHNGEKIELITVFGTRWLPFENEIADCTEPAKGLGIHGVPWIQDPKSGQWSEDISGIGKHVSDGCVRMATKDIEELFSIIISRPTTVELVRNFYEASPPGKEVAQQNGI